MKCCNTGCLKSFIKNKKFWNRRYTIFLFIIYFGQIKPKPHFLIFRENNDRIQRFNNIRVKSRIVVFYNLVYNPMPKNFHLLYSYLQTFSSSVQTTFTIRSKHVSLANMYARGIIYVFNCLRIFNNNLHNNLNFGHRTPGEIHFNFFINRSNGFFLIFVNYLLVSFWLQSC